MINIEALAAPIQRPANEDLCNALRDLLSKGLSQTETLRILHDRGAGSLVGTTAKKAIERASEIFALGSEDNVEVDNTAIFSQGDNGVWVSAWVHVSNDELGIGKPLPDDLMGKLWMVSPETDGVSGELLVRSTAGEFKVRLIENFTDAVDTFDDLGPHEHLVMADTRKEAAEMWDPSSPEEVWVGDKDDDCYGFYYRKLE